MEHTKNSTKTEHLISLSVVLVILFLWFYTTSMGLVSETLVPSPISVWDSFLDILKNGYKNLVHKTPNMDTLVAIGVIASFVYSIYGTVKIIKGQVMYVENLYYESAAIVIFFIKIGKYVENKNKDKTKLKAGNTEYNKQ